MTTHRDVTVGRLAIDAEIRDLAARFSDAVNRGDIDAFGALFVDDGVWEIEEPSPRRGAGRRNVVAMLGSLSAPWDFFFQMTYSGVIDVNPDRQTATARWQVQEIARSPDGSQCYDNVAIYYHRLARTDDESWRFAERRYNHVGSAALTRGRLGPSRGSPRMMNRRHCGELQPARPQPPLRPRRSAVGTPTSPAQIR